MGDFVEAVVAAAVDTMEAMAVAAEVMGAEAVGAVAADVEDATTVTRMATLLANARRDVEMEATEVVAAIREDHISLWGILVTKKKECPFFPPHQKKCQLQILISYSYRFQIS